MNALRDIGTPKDIKTLVDIFYEKVNQDEMLALRFQRCCKSELAGAFANHVSLLGIDLLGAGSYRGAPFPKHAVLPVQQAHFERWLTLFVAAVNENFSGQKSEEAKGRALCIADTFARRMGVLTDPAALSKTAFRKTASTDDMIFIKSYETRNTGIIAVA